MKFNEDAFHTLVEIGDFTSEDAVADPVHLAVTAYIGKDPSTARAKLTMTRRGIKADGTPRFGKVGGMTLGETQELLVLLQETDLDDLWAEAEAVLESLVKK